MLFILFTCLNVGNDLNFAFSYKRYLSLIIKTLYAVLLKVHQVIAVTSFPLTSDCVLVFL